MPLSHVRPYIYHIKVKFLKYFIIIIIIIFEYYNYFTSNTLALNNFL